MSRSLPASTLASVALHAAVLIALLGVRYERPAETSAYNVVQVEWVRAGAGQTPDGATEEVAASAEAAEAAEPPAEALREPRQAAIAAPSASAQANPEPPAPPVMPPETPTETHPEPPAGPPTRSLAGPPPPTPVVPAAAASEPATALTTPAAAADLSVTDPLAAQALAVAPTPRAALELVPVAERQRAMLDRRLERWTRDLETLVQSEPAVTWQHDGAEYTATFTQVPAADEMSIDQIHVEVRTARGGQRMTTEMRYQRLAFSHFAQFVDRWDPSVQIHDDEISGRFHSNSEIYLANTGGVRPVFHGKVTTARDIDTSYSTGRILRSDVFRGGLETRVGRIALPARFLPFEASPPADGDGVTRFTESTAIEFHPDGTFTARPLDAPAEAAQRRPLGAAPAYLLAGDGAEIHVAGVVNGKVLVHSPARIVILGNLTYAADPRADADADDYLGLVSDGAVEIAEPEITGLGDLTVEAAIFAKRRFQVRRYRSRGPTTLTLYGSVTAGSLSATEPRYRTRLEFDPRLEQARPPRFPLTGRFERTEWDGEWRVEPLAEDESFALETDDR